MAWHLHAVELHTGEWECWWGQRSYGTAHDLEQARRMLGEVAAAAAVEGDFVCFAHHLDGTISAERADAASAPARDGVA